MSVELQLDRSGLIPAIVQDADSGQVLMLGYVSPGSLRRTLEGGTVWFYSRSRQELWHKGDVSGSFLHVNSMEADCDSDTLLLKVKPDGPVCHTGSQGCFFTPVDRMPAVRGTKWGRASWKPSSPSCRTGSATPPRTATPPSSWPRASAA